MKKIKIQYWSLLLIILGMATVGWDHFVNLNDWIVRTAGIIMLGGIIGLSYALSKDRQQH
ncbi:hypothetical protein SDC9_166981 [bioreactor metagenome]|uniref:Uncharacterized protein n=1 Tax=bioreactor metagenome TaxID=1076179 RepID=A0A645G1C6_9ZZZZ|nr:hypothetical protein [Erysipelotrichaceae bacterium]